MKTDASGALGLPAGKTGNTATDENREPTSVAGGEGCRGNNAQWTGSSGNNAVATRSRVLQLFLVEVTAFSVGGVRSSIVGLSSTAASIR
jgi:hypothetical protein